MRRPTKRLSLPPPTKSQSMRNVTLLSKKSTAAYATTRRKQDPPSSGLRSPVFAPVPLTINTAQPTLSRVPSQAWEVSEFFRKRMSLPGSTRSMKSPLVSQKGSTCKLLADSVSPAPSDEQTAKIPPITTENLP